MYLLLELLKLNRFFEKSRLIIYVPNLANFNKKKACILCEISEVEKIHFLVNNNLLYFNKQKKSGSLILFHNLK